MITTVCLNPSFDRTVEVAALAVGGTNRALSVRVDAGGKGVNVAAVLRALGAEARCIGTAGEDGADRLERMLDAGGIPHAFLRVPGEVRTNTKVLCRDPHSLTEINERGPALDGAAQTAFVTLFRESTRVSGMAVLTGSLPPGCPEGTYARLIRASLCPCVLDAGGAELLLGAEAGPFLVKPNRDELEAAEGRPLADLKDVRRAAERLLARGAQRALVSMGADGALLVTPGRAWFAPALQVEARSTVGAGDALVGGFLAGWTRTSSEEEAFRSGVAAAAASVLTSGTRPPEPADYQALLGRVEIREV